jgi:hypothetical protein
VGWFHELPARVVTRTYALGSATRKMLP